MILSCSHIDKAFGTDTILSGVSFHIEDQEKAAVVGINGAGKSTLLKIIVGELAADSGEAVLARERRSVIWRSTRTSTAPARSTRSWRR